MPSVFPPSFPFFEVLAPARCVLPDLSNLTLSARAQPFINSVEVGALRARISAFPGLDDVKTLIEAVPAPWPPVIGAAPFIQHAFNAHWDVYAHLKGQGYEWIPDALCRGNTAGAAQELAAWQAAAGLFGSRPVPAWTAPNGSIRMDGPLRMDALFNSAWIDRPGGEIPYILDQLWVLSWGGEPNRRLLVGVEIDGANKWDFESDGMSIDGKIQQVARSHFILAQDIALFRIGSADCSSQEQAERQIASLWDRLSTAAFLHRMNIVSFLAQDASDVAGIFAIADKKYQTSGFVR